MAYENLALKYRPSLLADLIGQDSVSKTIANAIDMGRPAHAYLFYGPRGCGKTSTARILAKALNCHKPDKHNPCGKCPSCLEISQSRSIDVIEIDAASHTQVQNVRDVIIDNINIAPSRDKYKIYILDEVHMLSGSAFNALLKTMEEPPAHVVFIMATTEINKVPLTIVSRCQTFRFRPIKEEAIVERLREICKNEKFSYDEEALKLIAVSSGGAMRDSLTVLDRIASFSGGEIKAAKVSEMLGHAPFEIISSLFSGLTAREAGIIHSSFLKAQEEGYDILGIMRDLRNYFSECFLFSQGFILEHKQINASVVSGLNPQIFARLARKLNRIIDEIKFSDNPGMAAEMAFYTIIETPLNLEALVKRLENAETALRGDLENVESSIPPAKSEPEKKTFSGEIKREKTVLNSSQPAPEVWKKILASFMKKKISVYNYLLSSKITFLGDKEWLIELKTAFEKNYLEDYSSEILEAAEKAGAPGVKISFAVGKKIEKLEDVSVHEPVRNEELPSGTKWEDVDSGAPEKDFPEMEKMNKIFNGRIKNVNQIKK